MAPKKMIITLDGPAGAGKSSVAKALAKRLGLSYLDTGAMYRALTLKALRQKIDLTNEAQLTSLAKTTIISFIDTPDGRHVTLDGQDVELAIRSVEVTNNTHYAARTPGVRDVLVKEQQAIGQKTSLVSDGRDQGTVVFTQADYKFYVDADVNERVMRRLKELHAVGKNIEFEALKNDMQDRDQKDQSREVGPLKKADDAITIDSTGLTVDGTVDLIMKHIK